MVRGPSPRPGTPRRLAARAPAQPGREGAAAPRRQPGTSSAAPTTPQAWLARLTGWPLATTLPLLQAVRGAARFDESIKWGNLVFSANGPAVVLRAEPGRVLFILLRGQRLLHLEPRLKGSGKFELANLVLLEGDVLAPAKARRLAREAAALNRALGDPTKPLRKPARASTAKPAATRRPTKRTRAARRAR